MKITCNCGLSKHYIRNSDINILYRFIRFFITVCSEFFFFYVSKLHVHMWGVFCFVLTFSILFLSSLATNITYY